MTVREFINTLVEPNTLIRLLYKTDTGHEEVIKGDKPKMEHQLKRSIYSEREVVGVTDILYLKSHYAEAVNLVIKR